MGYHFPTFRRKLRSAFSRVADNYLTLTENCASIKAVCRRIYSNFFDVLSAVRHFMSNFYMTCVLDVIGHICTNQITALKLVPTVNKILYKSRNKNNVKFNLWH